MHLRIILLLVIVLELLYMHNPITKKEQCWINLQLLGADGSNHMDESVQIKF